MKMRTMLALLAFCTLPAAAADSPSKPKTKTYTPEIHGVLTSGKQPIAANVCMRQSGSEIRRCGYADASGRFFIPSSGPLHSAGASSDGRTEGDTPTYWLETGNVLSPQKLWTVDATPDRYAAIELDCDLARSGRGDPTARACEARATRPSVVGASRDDTPYRMARPSKNPAK